MVKKIGVSLLSLLLVISIIWFLYTLFDPIVTAFNVEVFTERIEFVTTDQNNSRLHFYDAQLASDEGIIQTNFNGSIDLNSEVLVTIDRVGNSPAILRIEALNYGTIGSIYDIRNQSILKQEYSYISLILPNLKESLANGKTYIFNLDGDITIGRNIDIEIYDEPTSLLRSGEVVMVGKSKMGNRYFKAGEERLFLGDRLEFNEPLGKAIGFAVINENPGIQAAYRVSAKTATIVKPGPAIQHSTFEISASLFDRIMNDPFFQGVSVLLATLLGLITILTFVMDVYLFKSPNKSK
jgi:hypothetical protein